jgi:hypothetical protein
VSLLVYVMLRYVMLCYVHSSAVRVMCVVKRCEIVRKYNASFSVVKVLYAVM